MDFETDELNESLVSLSSGGREHVRRSTLDVVDFSTTGLARHIVRELGHDD